MSRGCRAAVFRAGLKLQQYYGATGNDVEVWYGTVSTAGSSTITFSWSGTITGHSVEYNAGVHVELRLSNHLGRRHFGDTRQLLLHHSDAA